MTFNPSAGKALLKEAWPVPVTILVPIAAWYLVGPLGETLEEGMNYAGTLLQAVALFPIGIGLRGLRKQFGRPSLVETAQRWGTLLKATFVRLPPVTASVEGVVRVRGVAAAKGYYTLPPSAPMDQRLELAEQHIEELRKELDHLSGESRRRASELREELAMERRNREQGVQTASAQLESVAVGGFALEVMGLVWLFLGSTATSIPDDRVKWFCFTVNRL